jgi:hypothetical protein
VAGVPLNALEINTQAGVVARTVFSALDQAEKFQAWLLTMPDATLTAAPYSMTQADVTLIKSTFTDLNQLSTIFKGTVNLASAKDFRAFSKQLIGPSY